MNKISILFVCTENICRSPMAEAMMQYKCKMEGLHKSVRANSAGTYASQPRHKPDARAVKILCEKGIKMKGIKARRIKLGDFCKFDYLLAMDAPNFDRLIESCPEEYNHKISCVTDYIVKSVPTKDIPDPYYGGDGGFKVVYDLLDIALDGLLRHIAAERF